MSEIAWKEAAIAWSVCTSIHRKYAQGRDPFYTTRQADFTFHEAAAKANFVLSESATSDVNLIDKLFAEIDTLKRRIRTLEADRNICGQTQNLHPECRIWLVMNDMLKAKRRVRRDGR